MADEQGAIAAKAKIFFKGFFLEITLLAFLMVFDLLGFERIRFLRTRSGS